MPFDALFLTALSEELRPRALGCRVDKVQQPARDTVILALRGPGGGGRLLLTAAPNQPRIHFTDVPQENPAQPPMFCMLLRKHLVGGKLAAITQPRMERLVDLAFDCTDEMGSPTQKHLILEIMGRNSNLILTDGEGRILDCLRRVDFEMSELRQLLPGLFYHEPNGRSCRDSITISRRGRISRRSSARRRSLFSRCCKAGTRASRSTNGCWTRSAASRRWCAER